MVTYQKAAYSRKETKRNNMSETLIPNPDSSPNTTIDWSVLEGGYDKETDVNQANPETTTEQLDKAVMDVIAAREELSKLLEDPKDWPAAREQSVALQALIKHRNKLAEQRANERPAE